MDVYTLPFRDSISGPMRYDPLERVAVISVPFTRHNDKKRELIERFFENIISHETMHAVLHKEIDLETSRAYDRLGEYVSHTPISFPRGCE